MRPRLGNRGSQAWALTKRGTPVASMRPRLGNRGSLSGGRRERAGAQSFNEAPAW